MVGLFQIDPDRQLPSRFQDNRMVAPVRYPFDQRPAAVRVHAANYPSAAGRQPPRLGRVVPIRTHWKKISYFAERIAETPAPLHAAVADINYDVRFHTPASAG